MSAGLLSAQQALKRIDLGVKAATAIYNGVAKTPQLIRQLTEGRGAQRLLTQVVSNAANGKPAAQGLLTGLRQAAAGAR